jgi:hypothetical protein
MIQQCSKVGILARTINEDSAAAAEMFDVRCKDKS